MKETTHKMTDMFSPIKEVEQNNIHSLEKFIDKYSSIEKNFSEQIQQYDIRSENTLHNNLYK
ncbi:hypothetical protein [Labilibaculum euxinus]